MRSFAIDDGGDLVLAGGRLAMVSGRDKLMLDLSTWPRIPLNIHPTAPAFGSNLPNLIGNSLTGDLVAEVETEIRRVVVDYQQTQIERISEDAQAGRVDLWTRDEILHEVTDFSTRLLGPETVTKVVLRTFAGSVANLPISVTPSMGVTTT